MSMAGIDKIYGTSDQWLELYNWCIKSGRKYLIECMYPYAKYSEYYRPLSNFGIVNDIELILHCPLRFVRRRIKEQYGSDSKYMMIGFRMKKTYGMGGYLFDAIRYSFEFNGVKDLLRLWDEEPDLMKKARIMYTLIRTLLDIKKSEKIIHERC